MCFYRYNILLIFVFLIYISGYDTVDVIGTQIVNFRNNDKIKNMSVVLKNIPRSSKMAELYFKKYWSTFPYKTINVTGNEAVFENLYLNLDWYVTGRVMRSIVILQNNTKYGDKDVMTMELIENLEGDNREVPHACLQSCRIIIDYHETPSTESNLKETPSSSYPNLDIYPNTSIIYKPNSKHNISCIGDNLRFDFDLRLYQQKNDKYYIRANTTSNVLRSELYLTEQDGGTNLQCYIMWAYHTKATKTIYLLLDNSSDVRSAQDETTTILVVSSQATSLNTDSLGVKTAQDETNVVLVVPSQTTSSNGESYWKNFGLVTTTIVIIILLIIIILIVIRTQRIKTQGFLRSDRILSNSVSYMNLLKKYDTGFKTNDDTRGIQTNMEIWKKNECYANENHYDVGAYYSYATNETHKVYCHSENQHYD